MSNRGWLLFGLMCVIWGIPYLLIRVAVRDFNPATLVFFRTGGAALLLVPLAALRGELRPLRPLLVPLAAFALVEIALPWVFLASAERRISSSLSGLLIAGVPLVSALIARLSGTGERLSPANLFGLFLGLGGVTALVGLDLGRLDAVALLEIAVVVLGYSLGPAILARYLVGAPALGVIAASLAASAVVYAPFAASSWPTHVSSHALAALLTLILVCTALAFVLFFALIAEVGPVRSTVITYVNPLVAVALGVGLLGEGFTAGMAVGFVLIIAGSLLATRRRPALAPELRLAAEQTP